MRQTKQEQWASRLAACERSGQSQASWCRAHGVSLASLGYWRRKLAEADRPAPAVLPIQVAALPRAERLEVRLPNGVVLWVPMDPVTAAPLLRALAAC